jgi:hypothetical protein
VRQALELALEALQVATTPLAKDRQEVLRAIAAIKEALAQPTSGDYALGYSIGFGEGHSAGKAFAQPEQEPLEYWNAVEGWVKIDEVRKHFDSVGCATIYKTAGEGRVPLSLALAQPEQEPVVWTEKVGGIGFKDPMQNANYKVTATIAPQRKPLTDEQIDGIASKFYPRSYGLDKFARAIEAAHGIKE